VSREKGRLKELATLSGTKPPVPETQEYDFLNANLYDLAMFTLESFPDRYYSINNRFMLIVDEGSVTDRTCILAEIPAQFELDANKTAVKKERKFNRRDEYVLDPKGWIDENGEETAEEELKVVRVTFEDANLANMLDDDHEVIGSLAENTYQTNGVYKEGARYPDE
jgi:hypothetical protein